MICNQCPRRCNVDRENALGYCKAPNAYKLARASLHFWEEPCISGKSGSGAVFFSGCNLGCVFCQNEEISHRDVGKPVTVQRLRQICMELKDGKADALPIHVRHKEIDQTPCTYCKYRPLCRTYQ